MKLRISVEATNTTSGTEWFASSWFTDKKVGPSVTRVYRYGKTKEQAVESLHQAYIEHSLREARRRELERLKEDMEVDW